MSEWVQHRLSVIYSYVRLVVRSNVTGPASSTLKHHAADNHDTIPSHFKLTLGKPALL